MALAVGIIIIMTITNTSARDTCLRTTYPETESYVADTMLNMSTYFTFATNDLKVCGTQCLRESNCQSVNFDERLSVCELNEQSHQSLTDAFLVPMSGVIYMPRDNMEYLKVSVQLYSSYNTCPSR